MDSRPSFWAAHDLFPVGYTTTWREAGGRVFESSIVADEVLQRPIFTVRLLPQGDGAVDAAGDAPALAEGFSPETAWECAHRCGAVDGAHGVFHHNHSLPIPTRLWSISTPDDTSADAAAASPAWRGGENFGLRLAEVAKRLEGLPGVEGFCPGYTFVEQYTDWDTEAATRARRAARDVDAGGPGRGASWGSTRGGSKRKAATAAVAAMAAAAATGTDEDGDSDEEGEGGAGEAPAQPVVKSASAAQLATAPPAPAPTVAPLTAVADERARVGAMTPGQRAAYLASMQPSAKGKGDAGRKGDGDKAARDASKAEQRTARDAGKAAARDRAASERDRETAARSRRAKYPVDDDLVPALEQADAKELGLVYRARPAKPTPGEELPCWTGDLLAVCSFFEARLFVAPQDLAPVLKTPALGDAPTPTALRLALQDPGHAPLLYEVYAALLRTVINGANWAEPGGAAAAVAAAAASASAVPPHWLRTANRAGFACFPEVLRRWMVHGPRRHHHDADELALVEQLCSHGPGGLDGPQHLTLLMALCGDVLECGSSRVRLDDAIEKRTEAAKAVREEAKAAKDAARAADEALSEAKRRLETLHTSPPAAAGAHDSDADGGAEDDWMDDDYSAKDDEDSPKKKRKPLSRKEALAEAQRVVTDAEQAAASAATELQAVEEKQAVGVELSEVAVRRLPLGSDAGHTRYWWLRREPGTLYVERPGGLAVNAGGASTTSWASYTKPSDIAALRASLNPHGVREAQLLEALQKVEQQMASAMSADGEVGAAAEASADPPAEAPAEGGPAGADAALGSRGDVHDPAAYTASFESASLAVCAKELLQLVDCVVAANDPPPSATLRELAACLRQHRDGSRGKDGSVTRHSACVEVAHGLLAFEDEVCRAHDPRAAGITKAAARAAEQAARKAEREAAAAAAAAAAGEAPPPQGAEPPAGGEGMEVDGEDGGEEEEGQETGPSGESLLVLDETFAELEEWRTVETKPSGGTAKPRHPALWRQARYRDAWRAAVGRCVEAPAAAGPLAYAVSSLVERSSRMMASLAPKEHKRRAVGMPPARAPLVKGMVVSAEGGMDEDVVTAIAAVAANSDGDVPKYLVRDTLEELYRVHVGRDISRQKLAKHKIAKALPPDVLRAAIAKAAAEFKARGGVLAEEEATGGAARKRARPSGRTSSKAKRDGEDDDDDDDDQDMEDPGAASPQGGELAENGAGGEEEGGRDDEPEGGAPMVTGGAE